MSTTIEQLFSQFTRAAQAAHRQGKYLPVFRAMMAEQARTAGWREVARERRPTDRNEAVVVYRR